MKPSLYEATSRLPGKSSCLAAWYFSFRFAWSSANSLYLRVTIHPDPNVPSAAS